MNFAAHTATLAAAALMALSPTAHAALIDFEAVTSFAPIGDTYAASGVSFRPDAQGLVNDVLGPYFSNAPSPVGVMFVSGVVVPDAAMNVAGGFNALNLHYSSSAAVANAVQLWSGLDGTGSLLASYDLVANATNACSDSPFCHWDQVGGALNGVARSVTFGAGTQDAAFDNISIAEVPEPSTLLLAGLGLAAFMLARRRSV